MKDFVVVYHDHSGNRLDLLLMADSIGHAMLSARELLPPGSEIVRCFHNPSWN